MNAVSQMRVCTAGSSTVSTIGMRIESANRDTSVRRVAERIRPAALFGERHFPFAGELTDGRPTRQI